MDGNLLYLDSVSSSGRSFLAVGIRAFWEKLLQELVAAYRDEVQQILDKLVFILIGHSRDVVHHVSRVMLNQELGTSRLEVQV